MKGCDSETWKNIRDELERKYPWRSIRNEFSSCVSWFRTDNALYGSMRGRTKAIQHDNWKGRKSEYLTEKETHNILNCFFFFA